MATTTNLALPYPALSAAPNVPQDLQALAAALDAQVGGVILCTSATRPTARTGAIIYETDTKIVKIYDGTTWRRTPLFDSETLGQAGGAENTSLGGVTSTSFVNGTPNICGATFIAPPSGGVHVTWSGRIQQSTNSWETNLSFELRAGNTIGSGTVVVAASTGRALTCGKAVVASGPALLSASRRYRVAAGTLTAGSAYNVLTMHMVTGGTGTIENREITVEPVL